MIYSRLHGRLGNQMFQYAAARGLAARHGTQVVLDTRTALHRGEGVLTRVFDLDVADPAPLPPARHDAPLRYAIWRMTGAAPAFKRERGLGYNSVIETWPDNVYLHGYWQSEQYFAHIAQDMRRQFAFRPPPSPQNKQMAARIRDTLSVSLHVRRGDYLTFDAHTICDQTYYGAALAQVAAPLDGTPTVFVFSDDPDWARDNLPLPYEKVVVDFNGPDADYEDMRLMSLCQHNIIANSSFSWWAAWLNANPEKRVAGPSDWFGDPKLNNPDILPQSWFRI
ncbi:O-antigen biosynthesis glycosyltransferase WbnK (plasmid) [Pseudoseohaeicola sp. NH-UV-7]|uniref:alpha-1,2-fucosyltransferase n=1 Tax=unclassified Sulfitobacter TaxID=196795 RepID=UPI000E0C05FF|nr:alpha-1,2-fucosyltransferase [Sulfitobacter sp. JL08]AXI53208.1 alpha-1,2-fucosyltransferase [Sulfitobacter sp. JL08]